MPSEGRRSCRNEKILCTRHVELSIGSQYLRYAPRNDNRREINGNVKEHDGLGEVNGRE